MPIIVGTTERGQLPGSARPAENLPRRPGLAVRARFHGDALQLIEACLRDGSLIAGRFNDRLLGAARLQRHQDVWHLSQLCVRKITRRRGVAERLVNEGAKNGPDSGATLQPAVAPRRASRKPGHWQPS